MSVLLLQADGGRHRLAEGARWLGCGVLVLGLHAGVVGYLGSRPPEMPSDASAPIMIELAELPVAPAAEPVELPPGPQMEQADEAPEEVPPDPLAEAEDAPPPEPTPPVEEPLPKVEAAPVENIEVPLPPPMPLAAELTPPKDAPEEKPVERPKPRPKPAQKPKQKPKVIADKPPAPRTSAAASVNAPPADVAAAPNAGVSSSARATAASWRSRLLAHLNRNKRYPGEARARGEQGQPRVAFTIDRSGRVLGARLVGGSGSGTLDEEALAMVRRASPFPPPPPEVAGGPFTFTVPVNFSMR